MQWTHLQISPLLPDLSVLATESFTVDAASLPSFVINSSDDHTIDPVTRASKRMRLNVPETVKFYIRQYVYHDVTDLRNALHRYLEKYPADAIWTTVCLQLLADRPGKFYMRYIGVTCRNAEIRLAEDENDVNRRVCNWLRKSSSLGLEAEQTEFNPSTPRIFVYDSGHISDALELRDRPDLQNLERALISVAYPSLNSARGGSHHPMLPHVLSPTIPNAKILERRIEAWPYSQVINQIFADSRLFYGMVVEGAGITDAGFTGVVKHAQRGSLYRNVLPAMTLAKDITFEAMFTNRDDMDFSGRLTGSGPRAIDLARLQALGLEIGNSADVSVFLGPLVDLWALTVKHRDIWIAILHLIRYVYVVKPVLVRVYSAKVSSLLVNGCLTTVLANRNDDNANVYDAFFAGHSPRTIEELRVLVFNDFGEPIWRDSQTLDWITAVGSLCIVDYGRRLALCLPSYHGGLMKYDPLLLEPVSAMLQLVALKGVQVEQCIMDHVDLHGDPAGRLSELSVIMASASEVCRTLDQEISKVKAEIERLYRLVVSERHSKRWRDKIEGEMDDGTYEAVSECLATLESFPARRKADQIRSTKKGLHTRQRYWTILAHRSISRHRGPRIRQSDCRNLLSLRQNGAHANVEVP